VILTPDELAALTDSDKPAEQRAWLTQRGWVFETGKRGRPKVLRAHAEQKMGGRLSGEKQWAPDFSDLTTG
jgi:hypothetical protein